MGLRPPGLALDTAAVSPYCIVAHVVGGGSIHRIHRKEPPTIVIPRQPGATETRTKNRILKRVFHRYETWEETKAGLWKRPTGELRGQLIDQCALFMADTTQFHQAMLQVPIQWPISCEVNFTTRSVNRQAWLGHAACCIALNCPEEPTRIAWWRLTQRQRDAADAAAAEVIEAWEENYVRGLDAKGKNRNKRA